jgi:hypothetical protein
VVLKPENGISLRDIIRPGETNALDFVKEEELNKRTGIESIDIVLFTMTELLANALDKDSTRIRVEVQRDGEFDCVSVSDNGSKKLHKADVEMILDYLNKASSKRGWHQVTRGMLGNALKSIFGYSYALSEKRGLSQPQIIVSSGRFQYKFTLRPDKIKQKIKYDLETVERKDNAWTTVTVGFPIERMAEELTAILKTHIVNTSNVNPERLIEYDLYGGKGVQGVARQTRAKKPETCASWYGLRDFTELIEDCVRADPTIQAQAFIDEFKWFARKSAKRNILSELNARNLHSENGRNVQFVPSTPLKNFSSQDLRLLLDIMKAKSKPITKRSAHKVLGCVGQETFENLAQQRGWKLRYIRLAGVNQKCPETYHYYNDSCPNLDHVEYPYILELAIFDRDDAEGPKVFESVNFMASSHRLFHSMFDVQQRLARVGITENSPVSVIVHIVSPILPWTNYGKTSLGNIDSEGLIERAFDRLLPIPKTPRIYHAPPPARPLSWIPKGDFYDLGYRERLKLFAQEILMIDRKSSFHKRPRMRGWGYRCEELSYINDKGEFPALARAINDCRKLRLLPLDIISPDPDESRHFRQIHRATSPRDSLERFRNSMTEMLGSLPLVITDFYKDEKYYLMVVVEKGEILQLFNPICQEYGHIPNVSSKGWSNLEIRANIAEQCKWALDHALEPVLLLFYDMDPKGEEIPELFHKHLEDMELATGWNPDKMIIDRFGLTDEQIAKYGLSWVNNLKGSSGKEMKRTRKVRAYIQRRGGHERKCEMESLYKDEETVKAAEQICREAIEKYLGKDAGERFRKKLEESKAKLSPLYDNPMWKKFDEELTKATETLPEELKTELTPAEKVIEVLVDGVREGYYRRNHCPECFTEFRYESTDIGKVVRCRHCNSSLRLTMKGNSFS